MHSAPDAACHRRCLPSGAAVEAPRRFVGLLLRQLADWTQRLHRDVAAAAVP